MAEQAKPLSAEEIAAIREAVDQAEPGDVRAHLVGRLFASFDARIAELEAEVARLDGLVGRMVARRPPTWPEGM